MAKVILVSDVHDWMGSSEVVKRLVISSTINSEMACYKYVVSHGTVGFRESNFLTDGASEVKCCGRRWPLVWTQAKLTRNNSTGGADAIGRLHLTSRSSNKAAGSCSGNGTKCF